MPFAGEETSTGAHHLGEVDFTIRHIRTQVVKIGDHHIAPVAQEINYGAILRTRKKMAFKVHGFPISAIIPARVNVWHQTLEKRTRRNPLITPITYAGKTECH